MLRRRASVEKVEGVRVLAGEGNVWLTETGLVFLTFAFRPRLFPAFLRLPFDVVRVFTPDLAVLTVGRYDLSSVPFDKLKNIASELSLFFEPKYELPQVVLENKRFFPFCVTALTRFNDLTAKFEAFPFPQVLAEKGTCIVVRDGKVLILLSRSAEPYVSEFPDDRPSFVEWLDSHHFRVLSVETEKVVEVLKKFFSRDFEFFD